jgi:two-component system, NtrC family, nitrogen regulation sensor histidine kinase NtrY
MDTRLITQAFANLLKNAAESISARIAQDGDDKPGDISATLNVTDTMAWIDITDNGVGFPVHDRRRLLEPYMTTRAKGTGLGLAIVARAFEEHGGGLELADRTDGLRGACVRLHLPLADATTSPSEPADIPPNLTNTAETTHGG